MSSKLSLPTSLSPLLLCALLLVTQPLLTAVINVDGGCTLADAITAANDDVAAGGCAAGSGADEIRLFQDVALNSALPVLVNGSEITIHGNGFRIRRSPAAPDFRILDAPGGLLTLDNVTVSGGSGPVGAGVYARNSLAVINSSLSDNHSFTGVGGGAIQGFLGTITITDSILTNNSGVHGGAINVGDDLIVEGSHLVDNLAISRGGAIH